MMASWTRRLALDRILLVLALGLVASVLVAPRTMFYWWEHTKPIHGQAKSHEELTRFSGIHRRLGYFPQAATNIVFWYRESNRPILYGEFDMTESQFLDWAATMHWNIKEISSSESVTIDCIPSEYGGTDSVSIHSGYSFATEYFRMGYDRTQGRVFFQDVSFSSEPHAGSIDQCVTYQATIIADRYGIKNIGWHPFTLFADDGKLKDEVERLRPWFDRSPSKKQCRPRRPVDHGPIFSRLRLRTRRNRLKPELRTRLQTIVTD